MKRLVLVDGNALLHRAYHATPPLTTSKGELVNAVYGFSSMLLKVMHELYPDYLAITWDMKAPTFRHVAYEEYKATRKAADDALSDQYERVYEVVKAFNIPEFKLPGFEADDLVGALAKQAEKKEKALEIIIMTGDRDIMQLIDKHIKVFMPKKTLQDVGLYGEEEFSLRFGFSPKNLPDFKGLAGDASDNIPGVAGVGEVTATKLIQEYGSLEKVYQNLKKLPEKTKDLLEKGKDSALMSKKLATIETEIPIKLDLAKCRLADFDPKKVRSLFEELEFRSLVVKIPGIDQIKSEDQKISGSDGKTDSKSNSGQNTTDLDQEVEPILRKMSETGVLLDLKCLSKLSKDLNSKLHQIEHEIYSILGHQFNPNSPKQLSEVLFDELGLSVVRKTKTGRSTDEETLQTLRDAHPIVPLLLQYRQLFKLISTYVDALPKSVGKDKRVHSTFNVEGAATGRISSQDPNLQNIPIKGETGAEIRRCFIAPKGKILLSADYSQIELRILAHLAQDPGLKLAFNDGLDIHATTAARIFGVTIDKVSKEQRNIGKTMNFATLYGQGPHALSRQLGVEYHVAQDYIDEYFEQFPKIRVWKEKVLEEAREKGFVETLWGRKRYIPELLAGNRMIQSFGERAAVNMPVQGTAADMIKKAMVEIDKALSTDYRLQTTAKSEDGRRKTVDKSCQMILQIHDELLFECDPASAAEVGKMIKEKMENAIKLSVPVLVEVKVGPNWSDMKPLIF
ncbi:MAG: DNA polymerase [Candidatus Daviesbacteria bacterium]